MKIYNKVAFIFLSMALMSCASKQPQPQNLPDVAEAPVESTNTDITETTEKDLQALSQEAAPATNDPQTENVGDEFANPPANNNQAAQDPQIEQNPPAPETMASENTPAPENAKKVFVIVTGLDYNANENGGTINIKTNREATFTTRKNDKNNQFIIEMPDTILPKKYSRPYVTKEFPGAIASIQGYQSKTGPRVAKIVVQLRQAVEPNISQNGNLISISATGMSSGESQQQVAQATENTSEEGMQNNETVSQTPVAEEFQDANIMSNKSFDSFLLGQNKFYGKKISIEVTNQDVKEVFKFISEESGLNIILDDDVAGRVTMKLRKVPWDQALAILLQSKQLGYIRNGSILRVASLNTLKKESVTAREVLDAQKNLQNVRVQVYPISYAKADELVGQIKDLLTTRGKATADKRTNTIVVTDIPETLSKVKALVTRLDTQTPQVLIEARIIEARDTFERTLGVNTYSYQQGSGGSTRGSLNISTGVLDVAGDLTTSLTLLEKENQIKVLSAPRIVVLDRIEATIDQTTQFPIKTVVATASGTSTSSSFQDLKLQLKVKPQITVDGGVIMDVNVSRDIQGRTADSITGAKEVGKRNAQTQVLVENGDTIVLGGIYQSDVSDQEGGIPFLKDIPLLGWFFKGVTKNKDKNELVIMITPRILNRDKAFVRTEGM